MPEINGEGGRADGQPSMTPGELKALAELSLIERYGLPHYLLGVGGVVGALVENVRVMVGRHARLVHRLNVAAVNVAEQAGRLVETMVEGGTWPHHIPAVEPRDAAAVAELSGRERELHEQIVRWVAVIGAAAEGLGIGPVEPVAPLPEKSPRER